jgi:hypothetical protein
VHSLNLPSIPLLFLWNQRTPARSAHGGNNNYIQKKKPPNSAATAVCSVNSFQKRFKNAEEELPLSLDDEIWVTEIRVKEVVHKKERTTNRHTCE